MHLEGIFLQLKEWIITISEMKQNIIRAMKNCKLKASQGSDVYRYEPGSMGPLSQYTLIYRPMKSRLEANLVKSISASRDGFNKKKKFSSSTLVFDLTRPMGSFFLINASQLRRIARFALVLCTVTPLCHNLSTVVRYTVFRSTRVIVAQIAVCGKSRII